MPIFELSSSGLACSNHGTRAAKREMKVASMKMMVALSRVPNVMEQIPEDMPVELQTETPFSERYKNVRVSESARKNKRGGGDNAGVRSPVTATSIAFGRVRFEIIFDDLATRWKLKRTTVDCTS